jgi:hypothetical protein
MSSSPIAPGTALADVIAAFWASAGINIPLPTAMPSAAPSASVDTIVTVLFIAVLPASMTWRSCSTTSSFE